MQNIEQVLAVFKTAFIQEVQDRQGWLASLEIRSQRFPHLAIIAP